MLKHLLFFTGVILLIVSLSGLVAVRLPSKKMTRTFPLMLPPPPPAGFYYTVRWGDTLYSIARRFGTTVEAIAQANGILNSAYIRVGQRLFIPAYPAWPPPPPPIDTPTHTPMPMATPIAVTLTPTSTFTPAPTKIPVPTLTAAPTPTPIPTRIVEVEWPPKMEKERADTIRISLILVKGDAYTPVIEISRHIVTIETPLVMGTPGMPIERWFGEQYDIVAIANLYASNFTVQPSKYSPKAIDQPRVTWVWNITPLKASEEPQTVDLILTVLWEPRDSQLHEIERDIWRTTLEVLVVEPLFTRGQINILGTLGSIIGPALTIPWLYDRWKERQEEKRAKRLSASG